MRLPSPPHPQAPSCSCPWEALDSDCDGKCSSLINKTKVEPSTKALGSHMSPDIAGSFSGMQLMCQAVLSAGLSKPEEGDCAWTGSGNAFKMDLDVTEPHSV